MWTSPRGGPSSRATAAGTITGGSGQPGPASSSGTPYYYGGLGGWGYGSGAGGGFKNSSGYMVATDGYASGVLATLNHILADINSVSVTVGTGSAYLANYNGGGCNGAVAVFW